MPGRLRIANCSKLRTIVPKGSALKIIYQQCAKILLLHGNVSCYWLSGISDNVSVENKKACHVAKIVRC